MYGRSKPWSVSLLSDAGGARKGLSRNEGVVDARRSQGHPPDGNVDGADAVWGIDRHAMQIRNLVDWRTHLKTLRAWKEQGKGPSDRHYALHGSALDELAAIVRSEKIDAVQLVHSIGGAPLRIGCCRLARRNGVAVIVNQPFGQGSFFRRVKGQGAARVGVRHGHRVVGAVVPEIHRPHPVTCVIPGTSRPDNMRDNVAAGFGPMPDAAARRRIAAYWDAL